MYYNRVILNIFSLKIPTKKIILKHLEMLTGYKGLNSPHKVTPSQVSPGELRHRHLGESVIPPTTGLLAILMYPHTIAEEKMMI